MMKPSKEEVVGHYNKDHTEITRAKRTKRHGLQSQLGLTLASTSSSDHSGAPDPHRAAPSPTPSAELTDSTIAEEEEEEDMANCLILLAQGRHSRKVQEQAALSTAYQCKTCSRRFASFQALGGHRASHKKPRADINTDEKKPLTLLGVQDYRFDNTSTTLSLQLGNRDHLYSSNNKSKVHDCSICGAEFSSGQALGGHMRRHRTFMSTATTVPSAGNTLSNPPESHKASKKRNILQLDLNLPAPEDHDHLHRDSSSFSLVSKEPVLFFSSTSALVDCHY
ncbi:zinc finger protein ZAT5-like [Carya illinoinensis]|uniref:C2H2-type domain-containing protein n=1 Tax=Carya illinoinensis TaxID=32201 RepID=A0A8T1PGW1_CARIL|nr:zinc finger protein ZAT5-like [Carya illinoinensis]KAG6639800.1 hypothetical protein CIPAW_10G127500 [Carya illinoinensis]